MSKCQKPSHCSHILCLREWAGEVRYQTQKMHPWGHIFRVQESSAFGVGRWWQAENPKTSIRARFGDGSGGGSGQMVGNPKNEQSCSLSGFARWWWQQEPRNEHECSFRGWWWQNPKASSVGVGRMAAAAAAAGRGWVEPRKRTVMLAFGVRRWWWQPEPRNEHSCSFRRWWRRQQAGRGRQNPENEQSCSLSGLARWCLQPENIGTPKTS